MNLFIFLRFILLMSCYYPLFSVPITRLRQVIKTSIFLSLSQKVLYFFRPFHHS